MCLINLFIWEAEETDRQDSSYPLVHIPNACNRAGAGRGPELAVPSRLPTWMAGTQLKNQGCLQGLHWEEAGIRSWGWGMNPGTPCGTWGILITRLNPHSLLTYFELACINLFFVFHLLSFSQCSFFFFYSVLIFINTWEIWVYYSILFCFISVIGLEVRHLLL